MTSALLKVGKYLRKDSLDELPQLFNVLQGKMSLVNLCPLTIRYVKKNAPKYYFRHDIILRITGLGQVCGRSYTDSDNLFKLRSRMHPKLVFSFRL